MPLLYPDGQIPKAILCVDVVPEVVVAGRVFVRLLSQSEDFSSMRASFANETILAQTYQKVVNAESNDEVKKRLQTVSVGDLKKWFTFVLDSQPLWEDGFRQTSPLGDRQRVNDLAVLRDNFKMYHTLAHEGNIGVGYADMTNSAVLNTVKDLPDFTSSRNVIYMSNVIDHLTRRGTDLSHMSDMSILGEILTEGEERGNYFVDTTQMSLDYNLRASTSQPIYQPDDFRYRSRTNK